MYGEGPLFCVCRWLGCNKELVDMKSLVEHVSSLHLEHRKGCEEHHCHWQVGQHHQHYWQVGQHHQHHWQVGQHHSHWQVNTAPLPLAGRPAPLPLAGRSALLPLGGRSLRSAPLPLGGQHFTYCKYNSNIASLLWLDSKIYSHRKVRVV